MTHRRFLLCRSASVVICSTLVLACSDRDQDPTLTTVVSDTAGFRMVKNRGPDRTLAIQEALRVGVVGGDPDLEFHEILDLAVDSLGGIWVSDSNEGVRHFGPDGEYLGYVGGRGEGPGEARDGYGDVWVGHGTVLAATYGGQIQVFSGNGTLLGQRSRRVGPGKYLIPLGPVGERWSLYLTETPFSEAELVRGTWTVGRGPVTESGFDSLLVLPGILRVGGPSSRRHASYFYGPPGIDGDSRGNVYYSHPLEYRIDVFDASGQLVQVVSREIPPTPLDPDIREEVTEGARQVWRDLYGGQPPPEEKVLETVKDVLPDSLPGHLPFLQGVFVSRDGHLWAHRGDRHTSPAMRAVAEGAGYERWFWREEWRAPKHFDLFSPDGLYRGSVILPRDFIPLDATGDRIIGSIRNELGIQFVVAFSVEEGAP